MPTASEPFLTRSILPTPQASLNGQTQLMFLLFFYPIKFTLLRLLAVIAPRYVDDVSVGNDTLQRISFSKALERRKEYPKEEAWIAQAYPNRFTCYDLNVLIRMVR